MQKMKHLSHSLVTQHGTGTTVLARTALTLTLRRYVFRRERARVLEPPRGPENDILLGTDHEMGHHGCERERF